MDRVVYPALAKFKIHPTHLQRIGKILKIERSILTLILGGVFFFVSLVVLICKLDSMSWFVEMGKKDIKRTTIYRIPIK